MENFSWEHICKLKNSILKTEFVKDVKFKQMLFWKKFTNPKFLQNVLRENCTGSAKKKKKKYAVVLLILSIPLRTSHDIMPCMRHVSMKAMRICLCFPFILNSTLNYTTGIIEL